MFHADSVTDEDETPQAGENDEGSHKAGDQSDPVGHDKKDDWDFAIRFRDIQRYGYLEPKQKKEMSERAIQSILDRARESLGPIQKPYHYQLLDAEASRAWGAEGGVTELDVEETLHHREPMFQARVERNHGMILVLDTSLSMKGERLALLGVTVAAVALSVPSHALCILGFDSEIHAIKEFGEDLPVQQVIERTVSIPAGGFTNIDLGLKAAKARIESSQLREARLILVSDGRYTEGKNPVIEARNLRMVHAVKIGKDPGGRTVMKEIAETGQGRFSEVREMHELPGFILKAIRAWVK